MTTQARPSFHRHAIPAAIVFATGIAVFLASEAGGIELSVLHHWLSDGLLALLWLAAVAGIGSIVAPRLDWPTHAGLGIGVTSILLLLLGLSGWLGTIIAWLIIATGLVPVAIAVARSVHRSGGFKYEVDRVRWLWLLAAPSIAVMLVAVCVLPGVLWGDEPHGYDVVSYHLQIPREWYEAGRILPLPHNVFSYFPLAMETHYLLAMHLRGGPWAGMYLAQMLHALTVVVAAAAVYRFTRPRGRFAATIAAVLLLATPWSAMLGSVAYNEGLLILFAALCFGWALRAAESNRAALLCGAFAGFAIGVKLTAAAMVAGAAAIGVLAFVRPFSRAAIVMGVAILVASPWFIRNVAWTGNPVFPEASGLFGRAHFSQGQIERWRAAHSARADQHSLPAKAQALWRQVLGDWRFGFLAIPVPILLALVRRRGGLLLVVALAQVMVWLAFTHLQGRFLVTLLPVAALLAGICADRAMFRVVLGVAAACALACNAPLLGRLLDANNRVFAVDRAELFWELPGPRLVRESGRWNETAAVALAGDARAFWWPIPMSRLTYRTVFDVDVREGEPLVDAWVRGAPENAIVVVDPGELRRFAKTYRGLGDVPPEVNARDQTYIRP
jgi:hypothetical protein